MRVLGGSARSVPLKTVPDNDTRPILDRLKKSLFSMLDAADLLQDRLIMDLYAGTGTIGIEALSRGAAKCLFVERRAECIALLRENLDKTRLAACAEIVQGTVLSMLQSHFEWARSPAKQCDFISYDPPFAFSRESDTRNALETEMALAGQFLKQDGRLMLRTEKSNLPPKPDGLILLRHWQDGPHAMCFYGRVQ